MRLAFKVFFTSDTNDLKTCRILPELLLLVHSCWSRSRAGTSRRDSSPSLSDRPASGGPVGKRTVPHWTSVWRLGLYRRHTFKQCYPISLNIAKLLQNYILRFLLSRIDFNSLLIRTELHINEPIVFSRPVNAFSWHCGRGLHQSEPIRFIFNKYSGPEVSFPNAFFSPPLIRSC